MVLPHTTGGGSPGSRPGRWAVGKKQSASPSKTKASVATAKSGKAKIKSKGAIPGAPKVKSRAKAGAARKASRVEEPAKIVVKHEPVEVPEGLPAKFLSKSTFNTYDIMHSPVEKTLAMIDKILSGERFFTM